MINKAVKTESGLVNKDGFRREISDFSKNYLGYAMPLLKKEVIYEKSIYSDMVSTEWVN